MKPAVTNPKFAAKTTEICYEAFVVEHSGITHTPLWLAEHLFRSSIESAQPMSRQNSFHADENLPNGERAELSDYIRSGFDREHMARNGGHADPKRAVRKLHAGEHDAIESEQHPLHMGRHRKLGSTPGEVRWRPLWTVRPCFP